MTKYKEIPMDVSIHVRYLHQGKGEDLIIRSDIKVSRMSEY